MRSVISQTGDEDPARWRSLISLIEPGERRKTRPPANLPPLRPPVNGQHRSETEEPCYGFAGRPPGGGRFGLVGVSVGASASALLDRKSTRLNSSHEWISY